MGLMILACSGSRTLAQPAPALSSLWVEKVTSSMYPGWDLVQGALVTNKDHAGPNLIVVTKEMGYTANSLVATFNGFRLTEDRPAERILDSQKRIIGYTRYWKFQGKFDSGTFTFQATSLVAPIRTLSTRIVIR